MTSLLSRPGTSVRTTGSRYRLWNAAVLALVALTFLALGWSRRWLSDDGLIVVRTVRQVLAGNGPTFNVGERVEANTSTLWTYVLVAGGWITGKDTGLLAVVVGLLLSVAGLVLAADAARRLAGRTGGASRMVPLGALVVLGLPPFWDFASSGLETGLVFGWLGATWWALVRCADGASRPAVAAVAVLLGLAPLVRPELAVVGALYLVVLWQLRGRGLRTAAGLVAAAAVLPLLYQVFRMGYYGMVVPQTAIAKAAGSALWSRGLTYAGDFASPYQLCLPLLAVVAGLVLLLLGTRRDARTWLLVAAPVVAGLVLFAYVLRVGGDFMHGRMLLPPLFLLLLPVMVVPARRAGAVLFAGTAVWSVVCAVGLRTPYGTLERPIDVATGIADERAYWVRGVGVPHPLTGADYSTGYAGLSNNLESVRRLGPRSVAWDPTGAIQRVDARDGLPWELSTYILNLGLAGQLVGLDEAALDQLGLNYPLAAHAELAERGRPGHEKILPDSYFLADLLQPGAPLPNNTTASAADVALARQALACGQIAELQAAVRDPLTVSRFWDNLTGALARSSFTIPQDPADALARCD